ncbi:YjeJ family protein [Klebsiella aerogenes]|uniref:YjeJ family protein n=1 Tax=Klebsiella aerogenes TaxID=548 RepID=UPI0022787CBE|nr:YjeJ family protein [Klebsiella aerogenes]MCY4766305.1 YjeJ family protein [Klebsiella aerogenes]
MQGTFIGFNTAGITYEDHFMALLLKVQNQNGLCRTYYLQAPVLADLLMALTNRMVIFAYRLQHGGEALKEELIAYNEALIANTPAVDMAEVQNPNPELRIMSITLKPGETESTLILMLQNEQIATLRIDDRQVEALILGIQQSLKMVADTKLNEYLALALDFVMLYTVDLTSQPNIEYQQYAQEEWKLNLFNHHLAVLYSYEQEDGKKVLSGAVIKTSVEHQSEFEKIIALRLIAKSQKLKQIHDQYTPYQVFSKVIPSAPGQMLTKDECLQSLHQFYVATKAALEA